MGWSIDCRYLYWLWEHWEPKQGDGWTDGIWSTSNCQVVLINLIKALLVFCSRSTDLTPTRSIPLSPISLKWGWNSISPLIGGLRCQPYSLPECPLRLVILNYTRDCQNLALNYRVWRATLPFFTHAILLWITYPSEVVTVVKISTNYTNYERENGAYCTYRGTYVIEERHGLLWGGGTDLPNKIEKQIWFRAGRGGSVVLPASHTSFTRN